MIDTPETLEDMAGRLARYHCLAAATWLETDDPGTLLAMIRDGDPRVDDYLPAQPNLSGEMADGLTPARLLDELGEDIDDVDPDDVDAICTAYETAVADHWEPTITAELAGMLHR
jgi:hypothetical protein